MLFIFLWAAATRRAIRTRFSFRYAPQKAQTIASIPAAELQSLFVRGRTNKNRSIQDLKFK